MGCLVVEACGGRLCNLMAFTNREKIEFHEYGRPFVQRLGKWARGKFFTPKRQGGNALPKIGFLGLDTKTHFF
jgi:hypothetical protein